MHVCVCVCECVCALCNMLGVHIIKMLRYRMQETFKGENFNRLVKWKIQFFQRKIFVDCLYPLRMPRL